MCVLVFSCFGVLVLGVLCGLYSRICVSFDFVVLLVLLVSLLCSFGLRVIVH